MAGWTVMGWKGIAAGAAAGAVVGALAWGIPQGWRHAAAMAEREAEFADHLRLYADAASDAQAQARAIEQRMRNDMEEVSQNAQREIAEAVADRVASAAVAGRLRAQVTDLRQRVAAGDPAAAIRGTSGADALDLLANLFSRADDRAGELAAVADTSRIAGLACERAYDSLRAR